MKFDDHLTEILNNFATINSSIEFKPGNIVATMKPTKAVVGKAKTNVEFDSSFAIYSLSQLLGLLSLFEGPELDILDKHLSIKDGHREASFVFCDPSLIVTAPEKELKMPSVDLETKVTKTDFKQLMKAAATIGSPEVAIMGDGRNIYIGALNTKNSADNTYRVKLGETDKTFRMVFLVENLILLERDYDIQISSRGLAHFAADDVEYWIAVETSSSFEG